MKLSWKCVAHRMRRGIAEMPYSRLVSASLLQ